MGNNALYDAVAAQLDTQSEEETRQILHYVREGGANAGFNGFIYYRETSAFARQNMGAIYAAIKELAGDIGEDPLAIIANFGCLRGEIPQYEIAAIIHNDIDDATRNDGIEPVVLNALAWFALEEVANWEAE